MNFNLYALILVASAAVTLGLAPIVWRRQSAPGAKWFSLMIAAVGWWCLTYALEILANTPSAKLFWIGLEYFGIVSLAPLWLMFSLTFTHRDKATGDWYRYVIWIIPVLTLISVNTNEFHHFHYTNITYSAEVPGFQLALTHGPGFYLFTAYSYILLLIGTIILVWAIVNFPQVYRRQAAAIIIGALIPWVVNVAYVLNVTSGYDPTPLGFSITALIYFWAIFRLDLFNVIPVARGMVLESMTEGMFVLDSSNRIVDINPEAARIIGVEHPSDAIGRTANDVFAAFPGPLTRYSDVHKTREEFWLKTPNGEGYYELEINPVMTREGVKAGRLFMFRDITQRKQTEDALKKSERLYHTLIETLPLAVFQKNLDGIYTYVNQLYSDNEGIPVENILGRADFEIHPPELSRLYRDTDLQVLETGLPLEIEEEQELADGKRISIHVIKTAMQDTTGNIAGIQGLYWDTTQIQRAAREAQARLDELMTVHAISQAAAQLDMDSLITVVGQKIIETFSVQSVFIALYDKKSEMISVPYMINRGNRINLPDLPYGKGFSSEIIRTRKPLIVNSAMEKRIQELNAEVLVAPEMGLPKSWVGVPMIVGDAVIGVMSMQDYQEENAFSEIDLSLFGTIATNVGIAIQNAKLYKEVQAELTERKRTEADLADSQSRLQAILDNAGAGIGVTSDDGEFIFVNDRWVEMFGYSPQELSKMTLWGVGHHEDSPSIQEDFKRLLSAQTERFQAEKRFRHKDGSTFWGTASAKAIRQADGSLENTIIIISDITLLKSTEAELIRANQQLVTQLEEIAILRDRLREQAIRDPLTNLYNRRFMEETLTLEIHRARRNNSLVSLIMMDIDHFKLVNDQFGHKAGDHLLESLGQMLLTSTRKSDVACRYGGEEFLIVLPGSSLEDAARRAEQFRASFEAIRLSGKNTSANATLSIGVACYPMHGEDGEQVLNRADEALYKAKAAGRNCVVVYTPSSKN